MCWRYKKRQKWPQDLSYNLINESRHWICIPGQDPQQHHFPLHRDKRRKGGSREGGHIYFLNIALTQSFLLSPSSILPYSTFNVCTMPVLWHEENFLLYFLLCLLGSSTVVELFRICLEEYCRSDWGVSIPCYIWHLRILEFWTASFPWTHLSCRWPSLVGQWSLVRPGSAPASGTWPLSSSPSERTAWPRPHPEPGVRDRERLCDVDTTDRH